MADTPRWLVDEAEALLGPDSTQRSIADLERGWPPIPGRSRPARNSASSCASSRMEADRGELAAARRRQERAAEHLGAALKTRPRHPEDLESLRLCGDHLPEILLELGDHAAAARAIEELAHDDSIAEDIDRGGLRPQEGEPAGALHRTGRTGPDPLAGGTRGDDAGL